MSKALGCNRRTVKKYLEMEDEEFESFLKSQSTRGKLLLPYETFVRKRLEIYREAIAFIAWLSGLLEGTVRIGDVKDQLDRASTSIPLNIAEGMANTR